MAEDLGPFLVALDDSAIEEEHDEDDTLGPEELTQQVIAHVVHRIGLGRDHPTEVGVGVGHRRTFDRRGGQRRSGAVGAGRGRARRDRRAEQESEAVGRVERVGRPAHRDVVERPAFGQPVDRRDGRVVGRQHGAIGQREHRRGGQCVNESAEQTGERVLEGWGHSSMSCDKARALRKSHSDRSIGPSSVRRRCEPRS